MSMDNSRAPIPPPARRSRRGWLLGGAVLVAVLGLGVGYALWSGGDPSEAAGPHMQVVVNKPRPPAPVPHDGSKLEVLSPDMIQASQPPAPVATPLPLDLPALPPEATPDAPPEFIEAVTPHASFDCSTAHPGAEQLVCADTRLAQLDREMARAYRRALASGAPPQEMRGEQQDWLALREDAARHSPQALASVYYQRIDDLNQIADSQ